MHASEVRTVQPRPAPDGLSADLARMVPTETARIVNQVLSEARRNESQYVLLLPGGQPWLAAMPTLRRWSHRAPGTAKNYALIAKGWLLWALENDLDPVEPTIEDLLDFREARTGPGSRLSKTSWNPTVPALLELVLDNASEIKQRDARRMLTWNVGKEAEPRSLEPKDVVLFRDVGARGVDFSGGPDPEFYSPNAIRNGLYIDLLVATGVRRVEGASLLLPELPASVGGARHTLDLRLPAAICKRERPRRIDLPARWLGKYADYRDSEWHTTVESAQRSYRRGLRRGDLLLATAVTSRGLVIAGESRPFDSITVEERRRLVAEPDLMEELGFPAEFDLTPLNLFPGERMPGLSAAGWTKVFLAANARLARLQKAHGLRPTRRVTPHMLRHTFAVLTYRALVAYQHEQHRRSPSAETNILERRFANPMMVVRDLLGHSRMETTQKYLLEATRMNRLADLGYTSWTEAILEREVGDA